MCRHANSPGNFSETHKQRYVVFYQPAKSTPNFSTTIKEPYVNFAAHRNWGSWFQTDGNLSRTFFRKLNLKLQVLFDSGIQILLFRTFLENERDRGKKHVFRSTAVTGPG